VELWKKVKRDRSGWMGIDKAAALFL